MAQMNANDLILLTASWCGPCQVLKKQIEKENLVVEIVDIDEQFELTQKHSVRSVPTLLKITNNEVEKITGSQEILNTIKNHGNV